MQFPPLPIRRAALWRGCAPVSEVPLPPWVDAASDTTDLSFIDPMQRRRLSPLAKAMLHVARRAAQETQAHPEEGGTARLRTLFASGRGEMTRSLDILRDINRGESPSPTQFSLSVHNAVAGLWSIATGDRGATSALAAGPGSLAAGLLEAASWLHASEGPVLLVFGEAPSPAPFQEEGDSPIEALALLCEPGAPFRLQMDWDPDAQGPTGQAPLPALLAALGSGSSTWTETRGTWTWRLGPA